ncbi:Bug family tripartite tricarboxylate transporter substrate binding protein [Prosthecomicrobium sp. N25]|uniref:Bug family tripartite tricarboxylate transporter substrate binding protein n=1 Tax=Prosthecomicrobium sp. N25 TaxID=3129254 RepID=UPI003077F129
MTICRRTATLRLLMSAAGLLAVSVLPNPAWSQGFPSKGIELTLGFGPGSGIDSNARLLAPYLEKALGVPVTVINQPGGGAVPWANKLARTTPDGHTIGMVGFPLLQNNTVLSKVDYDVAKDFTFLGVLTLDPAVLAVAANSELKTLDDLISAAKAGKRISIGATGKGSVDYLIALSIQRASGTKFGIVNFDSTNEGVVAALGGSLSAMPMTVSSVAPYIQSGQLRALAAGTETRAEGLNAPTFKEAGVDLLAAGSYRAFLAPAGLPPAVKEKLAAGIKAAIDDPEFRKKAADAKLSIVYMTPDQTGALSGSLVTAARENLN